MSFSTIWKVKRQKVTKHSRHPKSCNTFLTCDVWLNCIGKPEYTQLSPGECFKQQSCLHRTIGADSHKEADTHIFLHAEDAAVNGSKNIKLISSDTDVIVLGEAFFSELVDMI